MLKKFISILLLSAIFLSGCGNSNTIINKTSASKASVNITAKNNNTNPSTDSKKQITSNSKDTASAKSAKTPTITTTEKTKVESKVTSVISALDNALNSLDDAKELNLN